MKTNLILFLVFIFILFISCKEENIFQQDPRLTNDLLHGHIVGKIIHDYTT